MSRETYDERYDGDYNYAYTIEASVSRLQTTASTITLPPAQVPIRYAC